MNKTRSDNSTPRSTDEQLVAYLDGELDDRARGEIEDRLASEPALRDQLQRLQQTWDCLDELPATSVDEKFTQSTIAMAAVAASQELSALENQAASRGAKRALMQAGALAVSLLLGLFAATLFWPDPNSGLVDDLFVLARLEAFQTLDDVDFLRELDRQQFFAQAGTSDAASEPTDLGLVGDASVEDRLTWVTQLAASEKHELAESERRFRSLSKEEQRRIRSLVTQIAADPHSAKLLATLDQYRGWLATLSSGQRADLAGVAPPARLAAMRRLQGQIERDESERQESISERIRPLNLADVEKLTEWMRGVLSSQVAANRDRYIARLPEGFRERVNEMPPQQQHEALMALAWRSFMMSDRFEHPGVSEDDIERLVATLSPEVREMFHRAPDDLARKKLMVNWLRVSLLVRWRSGSHGGQFNQVTEEELERHFVEDLTSDERAELLALPMEEMRDRLRDHYLRHESRAFHPPRHFGPPPGGGLERGAPNGPFRRPNGGRNRSGPPPKDNSH
ncbi:MAG: hypothetical protein KDA42_03480 [Planctomycetales bacterium]|nr:hypothetical protein [Planctomycetales bacterium]